MQKVLERKTLIRFFGFLILGLVLRFVTEKVPTPEKSEDLWYALPAFGVFLLFLLGLFSWGAILRTKSKLQLTSVSEEALFDLAVGSVFAYVISYVLTPLGLFSAERGVFLWLILASGFAQGFPALQWKHWFDFGKTWYSKLFMVLIPLIVITKLIEGIQFHQHGDSYVTYLVGPRMWGESGNFQGFLKYSQLFLSTSWESLYAWGTALMGFRGGAGLDISQWFSQWVTAGVGVFGVFLAGLAFCQRLAVNFPLSSIWFPIVTIFSMQVNVLRWTQNLAKNDFGIVFWGMAAYYFAFYATAASPALAFFTGLITGAAVVGKFTLIFLGGLSCLFVLWKGGKKTAVPLIVGGLIGCLPVFIRNYVLTSNPVFPWLPQIFPSPYLSDFAKHGASAATQKSFLMADLPMYLQELSYETPLLLSVVAILFFVKYRKQALVFLWIPLVSFVMFTVTVRPSTGIRYQNAALMLLSLLSVYLFFVIIDFLSQKTMKEKKIFALVPLSFLLLAKADLTFFTLFQIGNGKKFCTFSKRMVNTNEIGGPAKVWIRSHIKPTETIISFGDVHIYYLIDYQLTEVGQSVEYGKKIFHSTLNEAEVVFKNAPFDYLYLAGEDYYKDAAFAADQAKIADIMKRANTWKFDCKKFDNGKAQIWDLKCLK